MPVLHHFNGRKLRTKDYSFILMLQHLLACFCFTLSCFLLLEPGTATAASLGKAPSFLLRPQRVSNSQGPQRDQKDEQNGSDWLKEILEKRGLEMPAEVNAAKGFRPRGSAEASYKDIFLSDRRVYLGQLTFSTVFNQALKQPQLVVEHFREDEAARTRSADASDAHYTPAFESSPSSDESTALSPVSESMELRELEASTTKKTVAIPSHFYFDRSISRLWRPAMYEEKTTGYTKGHLAAQRDHGDDPALNLMPANISPQEKTLNGGHWSVLEALASSLRRFFKDVLIFTGPIWLPTDAASFLPSVSGDPLPRNIDPSGSSKQVYACLRPWRGAPVALPVSVETLTGSPFPSARSRPLLRRYPNRTHAPEENAPWLAHTPSLLHMFERCRWRVYQSDYEERELPPMQIEYEVLGHGFLPAATHFFKVLLAVSPKEAVRKERLGASPSGSHKQSQAKKDYWPYSTPPPAVLGAFVLPNRVIYEDVRISRFEVPLSFVELVSGIDLGVVLDIIRAAEAKHVNNTAPVRPAHLLQSLTTEPHPAFSAAEDAYKHRHQDAKSMMEMEIWLLRFDLCSAFHPNYGRKSLKRGLAGKKTFCKD